MKDELALNKTRGQMSSNSSNKSQDIRRRRSGFMGKVLLMVGRKTSSSDIDIKSPTINSEPQLGNSQVFEDQEYQEQSIEDQVVVERKEFNQMSDVESDPEFQALQNKSIEILEVKRKELHLKQLENTQRLLEEQLKELELKEIYLKEKQLKGQLKRLQIKELKIKKNELQQLQSSHDKENNEGNVTLLDHSDDSNSSSVRPDDDELSDLPEPEIEFVGSDSILNVNGSNNTLQTDSDLMIPIMRTSSRISDSDAGVQNYEIYSKEDESKTANISGYDTKSSSHSLDHVVSFNKLDAESSNNIDPTNGIVVDTSSENLTTDEKSRKKQHRLIPYNPTQPSYLKIKIYIPTHDTVFALKLDKQKLNSIEFLVQAIKTKVADITSIPELSLVTKNSYGNPVPLTNAQELNPVILEYILAKDKIYVLAE